VEPKQKQSPNVAAVAHWEVRPVIRYGLQHYMVIAPAVRNGLGGDLVLHESGNQARANLIAAAPELLRQLEALAVQVAAAGLIVPPNVTAVIAKAKGQVIAV